MRTDKHLSADPYLLKGKLHLDLSKEKPHRVPQIKWETPARFNINPNWHVDAGEESTEAVRLEGVYRGYFSSVSRFPWSPPRSNLSDDYNVSNTPPIPSSPIEEGERESLPTNRETLTRTAACSKSDQQENTSTSGKLSTPNYGPPVSSKQSSLEGDMMAVAAAGAAAALTAYAKSKDEGSLIDMDFLVQFLSNAGTLGKLIQHGSPTNAGSKPTSMLNEVGSSVPSNSKLDQMMMMNINKHGVAVSGVHLLTFSGGNGMIPRVPFRNIRPEPATRDELSAPTSIDPSVSFSSSKSESQMGILANEKLQLPSVATTPMTESIPLCVKHNKGTLIDTELLMCLLSYPSLVEKLIGELGSAAYTGKAAIGMTPMPQFPLDMKHDKGTLVDPEFLMRLLSEPHLVRELVGELGITAYTGSKAATSEHSSRGNTNVRSFMPKMMTPAVFPSSSPEERITKMIDEVVASREVTRTPMSPMFSLPSTVQNPVLVKNWISDLRRDDHFESAQFACSAPVEPFVPLPNPDSSDVFKVKRTLNEYGNSDGTGLEPMPEKRLLTPQSPYSFQKKDISELPRGDEQQGVMHMRPLLTDVRPSPKLGGAVPAPITAGKFMTPSGAIQKPCIYFNGPRGCRHGSLCRYLHITSGGTTPMTETAPGAKRMKLDVETSRRL